MQELIAKILVWRGRLRPGENAGNCYETSMKLLEKSNEKNLGKSLGHLGIATGELAKNEALAIRLRIQPARMRPLNDSRVLIKPGALASAT